MRENKRVNNTSNKNRWEGEKCKRECDAVQDSIKREEGDDQSTNKKEPNYVMTASGIKDAQ